MSLPIAAFDPGLSGALAVLGDFDDVVLFDLPQANRELDPAALARMLREARPRRAVVEAVGAMPGQGVTSMFNFGRSYGTILGVLGALEIPTVRVRPAVWKRHFGLIRQDKDASRALALRLYPALQGLELKRHHGRADALLLARFLLESAPRST